ncbi:hypothetical protein MMC22_001073 [Lobaria immixta]|nr:hypothetical protein [Lobaria immixta]
MPRLSKRKQQLAKIAPLVLESIKRRKIATQMEREEAFRIRQRQEDDFWDEYKSDLGGYSSSEESGSDGEEEEEEEEDTEQEEDKRDNITGITSYKLAQFTAEYLQKNRSEIGAEEINAPEQLE